MNTLSEKHACSLEIHLAGAKDESTHVGVVATLQKTVIEAAFFTFQTDFFASVFKQSLSRGKPENIFVKSLPVPVKLRWPPIPVPIKCRNCPASATARICTDATVSNRSIPGERQSMSVIPVVISAVDQLQLEHDHADPVSARPRLGRRSQPRTFAKWYCTRLKLSDDGSSDDSTLVDIRFFNAIKKLITSLPQSGFDLAHTVIGAVGPADSSHSLANTMTR